MGVKSTRTLTREQAEDLFVEFLVEIADPRDAYRSIAKKMTNQAMEDRLEQLNDMRHESGAGYNNYSITE